MKNNFLPFPLITIVSWKATIESQIRLSLSKEAIFLPVMSFLQSFGRLCRVTCFQNKLDWKLCTMHKTSIFTAFFSQKKPKIAQNRQLQISIFPKPIEMWLHGLGGVFWMGWSPFPPNMMARYLKTRKPPWLLARSNFSSFLDYFLAKIAIRQPNVNTRWPKIISWNQPPQAGEKTFLQS